MKQVEDKLKRMLTRPANMYARRNKVYIIQFSRVAYKKSFANAKLRILAEKVDFFKSVGLVKLFTR